MAGWRIDPVPPNDHAFVWNQMAGRSRRPSGGRGKSGLHFDMAVGNAHRGRPQG